MPAKITFTQKEQEALQEAICLWKVDSGAENDPEVKHLESLLAKMKKAREKDSAPKFHGIAARDLIDLASSTLGTRLKLPPNLTQDWFIKIQRAINSGGVTRDVAQKALETASKTWGENIWFETLVYSLPKLAAGAFANNTTKKPTGFTPTKQSGWLARLEEDD